MCLGAEIWILKKENWLNYKTCSIIQVFQLNEIWSSRYSNSDPRFKLPVEHWQWKPRIWVWIRFGHIFCSVGEIKLLGSVLISGGGPGGGGDIPPPGAVRCPPQKILYFVFSMGKNAISLPNSIMSLPGVTKIPPRKNCLNSTLLWLFI